ncbi:MAG: ankyrin repeat domain-containing protein [Desulfobacterales bacterium]|nr:ankyrin repeat domain-containing protein [Desulfobacterales bacterium]
MTSRFHSRLKIRSNPDHPVISNDIVPYALLLILFLFSACASSYNSMYDAAKGGDTEKVYKLLLRGIDVDEQYNGLYTPLMLAASNGHTETVTLLIKSGAEIDAKDENGTTSFMLAAVGGHVETMKLLKYYKADYKALDFLDRTPLMYAAAGNRPDAIIYLLALGFDTNASDKTDLSSHLIASQASAMDAARSLETYGNPRIKTFAMSVNDFFHNWRILNGIRQQVSPLNNHGHIFDELLTPAIQLEAGSHNRSVYWAKLSFTKEKADENTMAIFTSTIENFISLTNPLLDPHQRKKLYENLRLSGTFADFTERGESIRLGSVRYNLQIIGDGGQKIILSAYPIQN